MPINETQATTSGGLSGLQQGIQIGSIFGPAGTLIGAGVGAIGGALGGFHAGRRARRQRRQTRSLLAGAHHEADRRIEALTGSGTAFDQQDFRLRQILSGGDTSFASNIAAQLRAMQAARGFGFGAQPAVQEAFAFGQAQTLQQAGAAQYGAQLGLAREAARTQLERNFSNIALTTRDANSVLNFQGLPGAGLIAGAVEAAEGLDAQAAAALSGQFAPAAPAGDPDASNPLFLDEQQQLDAAGGGALESFLRPGV